MKETMYFIIVVVLLTACSPATTTPTVTQFASTRTPVPFTGTPSPSPITTKVPIGITEVASLGKGWASFVEWSPDRNSYAVGGSLGVRVYDAKSGTEIRYIPSELVSDLEFTTDGQLMGIVSFNHLTIIRLTDEKVLFEKEEFHPYEIVFSPKVSSFAYVRGCFDVIYGCSPTIIVSDYSTQKDLFTFGFDTESETVWVNDIRFNFDGTLLAAASSNGSIYIWNTSTGKLKTALKGHRDSVKGVQFSPVNKSILASYSEDGTVRLWDIETGKNIKTMDGFQGSVKQIYYSADSPSLHIFTDTMVQTFDTATEKIVSSQKHTDTDALLLQELPSSQGYIGRVDGLAYSPDGQTLAVSNHISSAVLLWDIPTKQIKATIETAASKLVYSHQGKLLASVDQFPSVYENPPTDENFSEDENVEISIWDTDNYARLDIIKTKRIDNLIFTPDDTKIAFNSQGKINIWDVSKGKVVQTINTEVEETILLSYSAGGNTISAVDAHTFSVKTWDVSTGKLIHTFIPPSNPNYTESIDLSNNILAIFKVTDVYNNTIELWNVRTDEQLQTLMGVNDYMYPRLTYSPDRKIVAISYRSGIKFYCSNTGNLLYVYDKVVNWIKFSFSPDGNYLAIGDDFGRIVIWDVRRIVQEPSCTKP